jgi:hypothetical protein
MTTMTSNRRFGIEIECFGITRQRAAEVINATGLVCRREDYGHSTPSNWKIVTDGSVHGNSGEEFEVVSPILSGQDGLDQVRKVATALAGAGAKVNKTCGLHVHVDAQDLSGADIINCVKRYAANESAIDGFMPKSRRAANNTYCQPMTYVAGLLERTALTSTARMVAGITSSNRYYKLNLCAFVRHGTLEFRQHSGTVEAHKMINWIIFCVNFVETSRVQVVREESMGTDTSSMRKNAIEKKFAIMANLLDQHTSRHDTISASELATAMDVEESTVASYISQFRAKYNVSIQARRGRGYYRDGFTALSPLVGIQAPTVTLRVQVPTDQGVFAGLSNEVASYFHERTMEFAQQEG